MKALSISLSIIKIYDSDVEILCNDFQNVFSDKLRTKRKISLKVKRGLFHLIVNPRAVKICSTRQNNNEC